MKLFICLLLTSQLGCSLYESDARKFLREQGLEYKSNTSFSVTELSDKHCQKLSIPFFNTKYDMDYSMSKSEHYIHLDFSHSLYPTQFYLHCRFSKELPDEFTEDELLQIEEITESYLHNFVPIQTKGEE